MMPIKHAGYVRTEEYYKGYQNGFRAGNRGNGAFSEGRKQGKYDVKLAIKKHLNGEKCWAWLGELLENRE